MKQAVLVPWLVSLTGAALLDGQTVINGSRSILGAWDASSAASTKPLKSGASLPASCSQGEFFFLSTGEANRRLYACASTNTWEQTAYGHGTSAQIPAACSAGQIYFSTNATAGTNLYFCTTPGNPGTWTQMSAGVTSAFGRIGGITAEYGDYAFSQISGTLPVSAIAEGSTGTGAVARAVSPALTTPSFSGAIGSNFNLGANARLSEIQNASSTGTGTNLLAKLTGAPATAVTIGTSDTTGIAGICLANCGTTGSAQLAQAGQASCQFDGATTSGNYVQASATVAGKCHDAGAGYPSSGQVIGRVLSTNVSAGTYAITMFSPGIEGGGGGGGSSTTATYTTANDETGALQNSRQWQDGTLTKINTSTAGKIAVDRNIFDRAVYTLQEDWMSGNTTSGTLGSNGWLRAFNNTAPTMSYPASENQHPGIFRCVTSAVNNDLCSIYQGTGLYGVGQHGGWKYQALVRIGSTSQGKYSAGVGTPGSNGIYAIYDSSASTKWRLTTCASFSCTNTNSTITAAASTWYLITLEMTVAGTVRFAIDNETAITSSANVPGSTVVMSLFHTAQNTSASSNTMDVDWMALQMTGLTR